MKHKSYRTVTLLSCMGEDNYTVLTELQSNKVERIALQSEGQFGTWNRMSAMNAAAIMVNRAHIVWNKDTTRAVLLEDWKTVFPCLFRCRIIHAMMARRMDQDCIWLIEGIVQDRTVEIRLKGNVMQCHTIEAIFPQGAPVSLNLFGVYISALTKWVE
jgi:hypothetical protein